MKENKEIKDINFNNSECFKSYQTIGATEYVNLCNDQTNTVPWGVEGWFFFVFAFIMLILALGFFVVVIREIFY